MICRLAGGAQRGATGALQDKRIEAALVQAQREVLKRRELIDVRPDLCLARKAGKYIFEGIQPQK